MPTLWAMKKRLKVNKFDFDEVYKNLVVPHFEDLSKEDQRGTNRHYSLMDACKTGFAVYSLKSSSLLDFSPKTPAEQANLKSCFGIRDIPSDNGLRSILDTIDSAKMRKVFDHCVSYLEEHGVWKKYQFFNGMNVISVDGVQHYTSKKIKCERCLRRKHQDGSISYSHSMLSAAIVCPGKAEVFIADNEPIVQQDGASKNDCERKAAKRLFKRMGKTHGSKSIIYTMDALYGCAPIIELIQTTSKQWNYIINAKEEGHKYLFEQFDTLNEQHQVAWKNWRRKEGTYEVGWVNDLSLNASHPEVKVNLLVVNFRDKKGKTFTFSYLTNIELAIDVIMKVVAVGRSRWKIENEVFNTLKNQQYNFEHNFGHGKEHLATNFAYLMLLAFTVDQIRQYGSRLFQSIWKGLKTKKATWDAIRTVFKMVMAHSMDDLCHKVLDIYQLRMIRI